MKISPKKLVYQHFRTKSVEDLCAMAGKDLPPIQVMEVDGSWVIIDGHHRGALAAIRGEQVAAVQVRDGDLYGGSSSWTEFLGQRVAPYEDGSFILRSPDGIRQWMEYRCWWCSQPDLIAGGEYSSGNHREGLGLCGQIREVEGNLLEGLEYPILGSRCSCCGMDGGNGAGGYSACCGAEVIDLSPEELHAARIQAWVRGKLVARRWDGGERVSTH